MSVQMGNRFMPLYLFNIVTGSLSTLKYWMLVEIPFLFLIWMCHPFGQKLLFILEWSEVTSLQYRNRYKGLLRMKRNNKKNKIKTNWFSILFILCLVPWGCCIIDFAPIKHDFSEMRNPTKISIPCLLMSNLRQNRRFAFEKFPKKVLYQSWHSTLYSPEHQKLNSRVSLC